VSSFTGCWPVLCDPGGNAADAALLEAALRRCLAFSFRRAVQVAHISPGWAKKSPFWRQTSPTPLHHPSGSSSWAPISFIHFQISVIWPGFLAGRLQLEGRQTEAVSESRFQLRVGRSEGGQR